MNFDEHLRRVTTFPAPRDWQRELATESSCRDRLIGIPTGRGKTEGVLAAWSYHRRSKCDGLAFLESLLRASDVRASRLKTNDPIFAKSESEEV